MPSPWLRLPQPPWRPPIAQSWSSDPQGPHPPPLPSCPLWGQGRGSWPGGRRASPASAGTRRGAAGLPAQRPPSRNRQVQWRGCCRSASLRTELPLCNYSLTFSPLVFIRSLCLGTTVDILKPGRLRPPRLRPLSFVSLLNRAAPLPLSFQGRTHEGRAPLCLHSSLSHTAAWRPPCRTPGQGTLLLKPELLPGCPPLKSVCI